MPHRRWPPAGPLSGVLRRRSCCADPTAPGGCWRTGPGRPRDWPTRWKTVASWRAWCPSCSSRRRILSFANILEVTSDALQALSPDDGAGVALLSGGHADPLWFEHVLLSRRNVDRPGRGRRPDAAQWPGVPEDPARAATHRRADASQGGPSRGFAGIVGREPAFRACWMRMRSGSVRMVNDRRLRPWPRPPPSPRSCPALARRLLGEDLQLASQATIWLGEGAMVRTVLRDLRRLADTQGDRWQSPPVVPMMLSSAEREELWQPAWPRGQPSMRPRWRRHPSVAPCAGELGLEAKPIALRMFMTFDGTRWRALPGGLARALSEEDASGRTPAAQRACPRTSGCMEEETQHRPGRLGAADPDAGDPPHRRRPAVARGGQFLLAGPLSGASGGSRPPAARHDRPHPCGPRPTAREIAEMQILVGEPDQAENDGSPRMRSVLGAGMLAATVMRAFRHDGGMRRVLSHVARQVDHLRDRLTGRDAHRADAIAADAGRER